jgi:hypothetical protein
VFENGMPRLNIQDPHEQTSTSCRSRLAGRCRSEHQVDRDPAGPEIQPGLTDRIVACRHFNRGAIAQDDLQSDPQASGACAGVVTSRSLVMTLPPFARFVATIMPA